MGESGKSYDVKIKYKSGREYVTTESDIQAASDSLAYVNGFMLILSHMYLEQKLRENGNGLADYSDATLDVYSADKRARYINSNYTTAEKKAIHAAVFEKMKSTMAFDFPFKDLDHLSDTYIE